MSLWNTYTIVKKPKKVHQCVWCYQPIDGEHQKFTGEYEGDFQNWRIHLDCVEPMRQSPAYQEDSLICDGPHFRGGACKC